MHTEQIPIVYIRELNVWGLVIQYGAHVSKVRYQQDGQEFEEILPTEDLVEFDRVLIDYEDEDEI